MPQLNPTPWLTTLIAAWAIVTLMMKLILNNTKTVPPNQCTKSPNTKHWPWTWQ